jgi:hypothetical protein
MASNWHRVVCRGLASTLLGCAAASPVAPGSVAEIQLHAPCPANGSCAEPLVCVGGEDAREPASCELSCDGSCPVPLQCMPRADGQRGGVCTPPAARAHPWGS